LLLPPFTSQRRLVLEVLPGPGTRYGPFPLEVRDETDRVVAEGLIPPQRSLVKLDLPLDPKCRKLFHMKTRGGGYRNHTHGYPLDFAIYGIRWEKAEAKQKSQRFEVVRASQSGQELTAGRLGQFVALALQDFQVAASRWLRLVRDRLLQNRRFCPPR